MVGVMRIRDRPDNSPFNEKIDRIKLLLLAYLDFKNVVIGILRFPKLFKQ